MLSYSVSQNMVLSGSWTKRVEEDDLDSGDNRVRNKIDSQGIDIVESPFRHDRIEALGGDRAKVPATREDVVRLEGQFGASLSWLDRFVGRQRKAFSKPALGAWLLRCHECRHARGRGSRSGDTNKALVGIAWVR